MEEKTIFHAMVEEEYERSKRMLDFYQKELEEYPKGILRRNLEAEPEGYYLECRVGDTIKTERIKDQDVEELEYKLSIREHKEKTIQQLKKGMSEMEYMLAYWKQAE